MRKLIRRLAGPCDQRDALGIALGCLSLLLACVLATRRNPYFWYDEVATATLVRDPSVTHMLGAIVRGAENNPPLYQLALRGWIAIFGDTALSMRLPSALCASVALAIAWRTLRRWYSTAAVSLGIGVGILGSITIIDQVAQARSYGFFLLAAASAFAATVSAMRSDRTARASLLLLFLTHLFLVYSHTLGLASSGSLLAAAVVVDAWRGRLRPLSYGAVVAAWLLFAPWVPTLLRQGKIATPRNWLLPPDREAFFAVLGAQTRLLPIALVVVAVASTLSLVRGAAPVEDAAAVDVSDERPPIAAGVALIAVIPAVFVLSRLTTPVFLDRYLIPAALGWVALVSGVAQGSVRRADGGRGRWLTGVLYAATFAVIACFPPLQAMAGVRSPAPDIVVSGELAELPIVIEDAHEFWPLEYYATRARGRFHYLIDWESARDERAARGAEQQAILMDLYRREGYLEGAVTDAAGFLCANRRFLVVDRPEFPLFERRIAPQQGYRVRGVGTYRDATIRLVERQGPTC